MGRPGKDRPTRAFVSPCPVTPVLLPYLTAPRMTLLMTHFWEKR